MAATVVPVAVAQTPPPASVSIEILSNRADLVSGDNVLVQVNLPPETEPAEVRVLLNDHDVTEAFAVRPNGEYQGVVTGLELGDNTLTAALDEDSSAGITITNHPIGGPIFSGPQIQPWYCLPDALDAQCNRPVKYEYFYKATSDGSMQPYDPDNPPASTDVAQTTTDENKTVPYVVRVETGNVDRNEYRIAVLMRPEDEWTRWTGPPSWNHKVWSPHGAGCSTSHTEGPAPNALRDIALSRGFAVLSSAMADNAYSCNLTVQAESVMMAKEHLVESYGDVRYLFGVGCSGGSIAMQSMANAYPGLYDGIIVGCSFPDVPINDLLDCTALLRYWDEPWAWAPGVVWPEPQQAAAGGLASTSVCHLWTKAYGYPKIFDPHIRGGLPYPRARARDRLSPGHQPRGPAVLVPGLPGQHLRPAGRHRAGGRWSKQIGRGFANRPYDNVGVQYGLRALMTGKITTAQFVDLNAKVGGIDIDFARQPERVEGDPEAIEAAYRSGVVNEANNLDRVPIIDIAGWIPADRYEIHDNYKSWGMRARLDASNGRPREPCDLVRPV